MQLQTLTDGCPVVRLAGPADTPIAGMTDDSRRIEPGGLFVCRGPVDGKARGYLAQAVERGAAAVLTEAAADGPGPALPDTVSHLATAPGVPVDQRLAGQLAERFFGHPAKRLTAVGITGTNGKTTTATITQHLLRAAGRKTGLLGTIHLDTGHRDGPRPAELTTPGAIDLSRLLAETVRNGFDGVVMEVSSHALHQGRADHLRFAAACFTNLTQDHLDYHGTMAAYADAKALLFEALDQDAAAVLNGDDPAAERMARRCRAGVVCTSTSASGSAQPALAGASGARVEAIELTPAHSRARFTGGWGAFEARLPLVGPHNLSNALQAAALAHAVTGIDSDALRVALERCPPVPGRLEPVGADWGSDATAPQAERLGERGGEYGALPNVLVDYAHTPDALINAASSLRPLLPEGGRLIVVFGCGGDRDRAKRPLMARAACRYADSVVLTSDNPRTEDPQRILDDARAGFAPSDSDKTPVPGPEPHIEIDRAEAIRLAIRLARPVDTVLIAGKGHEDYQVIGTEKRHFDDREHAAAAQRELIAQHAL